MVCSEILACALVALALLASCAIATVGSSFDIQQISLDVNNASAVQDLVSELRPKLLPPPKAVPPKIGRMRPTTLPGFSPLRKGLLETRQSCTGNQNNYCFGNSQSYCANCGLCCIQSSGGWCCPPASSGFICCPAATANSGGGCCYDWQFCQSTGCVDPSVTVTVTQTSWSTVSSYITQSNTYTSIVVETSTVGLTDTSTIFVTGTAAYAAAATKKRAKRTPSIDVEKVVSEVSMSCSTGVRTQAEQPAVTLLSSPNFDALSQKLERIGLIVKRAVTSTITAYATVTSTTTIPYTLTYSVYETSTTVAYATSCTTVVITNSQNASPPASSTTVVITNSRNAPPPASSTSQAPNDGSSNNSQGISDSSNQSSNVGNSLSTGVRAGIGVGSAGGSALICIIIILWWRRRRRRLPRQPAAAAIEGQQSGIASQGTEDRDKYLIPSSSGRQEYPYGGIYASPSPLYPPRSPVEIQGRQRLPHEMPQGGYRYGHEMPSGTSRYEMPPYLDGENGPDTRLIRDSGT